MKFNPRFLFSTAVAALILCTGPNCDRSADGDPAPDFRAVRLMLDIMDSASAYNPDAARWTATFDTLWDASRIGLADSLASANRQNAILNRMVDSLLSLPAYRLYYQQFRNLTAADHRAMFMRLPYTWVPSPGDVSRNYFTISRHTDQIRSLVAAIELLLDLDSCRRVAMEWLPDGDYPLPPIHFILDGNGDAFARDDGVVFDLYSLVIRDLLQAGEPGAPDSTVAAQVNAVLAHEFHHVFASPWYVPDPAEVADWRGRFRYEVTRSIVSEGIAMHCNPLTGFRKEIREDTAVVAFWIADLNRVFNALSDDTLAEEQAWDWYRSTFHDRAREELTAYLSRSFSGAELQREVRRHQVDRPTMVYTLGWWMVTRISRDRTDREAVLALLRDTRSLYRLYDEAVPDAPDSLRLARR